MDLQSVGNRIPTATGSGLGALFESLVTRSVRVYAEATSCRVGHLRTKNGQHEIDMIVESSNRACLAIGVKLADYVDDHDVEHVNWLHDQIGDRLADRIVVYIGKFTYRRPDGAAVVPFALLGP